MNTAQSTNQAQTVQRTPAQIKSANARSASRAKTLHWEGYEIEQVDTFTLHILRPLHRVLSETTQSFLKGGNGTEVVAFYVIDATEIVDGIVTCGCAGYEGWGDCCHAQLFKQAYNVARGLAGLPAIHPAKTTADAVVATMEARHKAIIESHVCGDDCGCPACEIEAAPVVPVTVSHATPASSASVCKKKGCTAPVGSSSHCVANGWCKDCQRIADFGA